MRIAQIGFHRDRRDRSPEALLDAWPTLVDVAESATAAGTRVSVIQSSGHTCHISRNGVDYHFLPLGGGCLRRRQPAALAALLAQIAPDVLHVHGLGFPREVLLLDDAASGVPILLQDHANRPPRWWRRPVWERCGRRIAGVAFCAREQARPFMEAGVLARDAAVYEIPEATSRFGPGDAAAARAAAGVSGEPLLLWVGHLDANKDPLTVLEGVAHAARALPGLELWCCYGKTRLLRQVRRRLRSDPLLERRTHLLGEVSHARVEQLMRAADVLVCGSHREGSGYALIEALACGLAPVVTDIPSFRALTGAGAVGRLWQPGDAASLCAALLAHMRQYGPRSRAAVRAHFERELSFAALGRKLAAVYEDVMEARSARARRPR